MKKPYKPKEPVKPSEPQKFFTKQARTVLGNHEDLRLLDLVPAGFDVSKLDLSKTFIDVEAEARTSHGSDYAEVEVIVDLGFEYQEENLNYEVDLAKYNVKLIKYNKLKWAYDIAYESYLQKRIPYEEYCTERDKKKKEKEIVALEKKINKLKAKSE